MKRIAICILVGSALAGCASVRPTMSYVSPEVTANDARVLAADAAEHLAQPLPPARTTIVLDPPASRQDDVMTPAMVEQLRATGYGVVEAPRNPGKDAPPVEGVPLRYLVSPLQAGVLMRLQYQGVEAARFYPRSTDGSLVEAAPFTVRQAGQQTAGVSQ